MVTLIYLAARVEVPVQQYASNYFYKGRKCLFLLHYSSMHSVLSVRKIPCVENKITQKFSPSRCCISSQVSS